MRIALGRREKPLVAVETIGTVGRALRARGIRAHVGTALLLGHAHADQTAFFGFDRNIPAVIDPGEEPRHPVARELGIAAQDGDRTVGHGCRTERPALHLRLHQVARGACHVRTGAGATALARPRGAVIAACRDALHERVPGRMEFDRIDALAAHVVALQRGRVTIGEPAVLEAGRGSDGRAVACEMRGMGRGPLARHGLLQRLIARE